MSSDGPTFDPSTFVEGFTSFVKDLQYTSAFGGGWTPWSRQVACISGILLVLQALQSHQHLVGIYARSD